MEEYLNWLHEMAKENSRRQQIAYNDAHRDSPEETPESGDPAPGQL